MKSRILIAALVSGLVLTACTPDVPNRTQAPPLSAEAALLDGQVDRIANATFNEIARADADKNVDLFESRVGGNAKTIRQAQYLMNTASADSKVDELPRVLQAFYVTNADTWPRVLIAVSEVPEDHTTPLVYMWTQEEVDADFQLQGWAHMIPGAALPAMPSPSQGAAQLPLGEEGLDTSPIQVINNYLNLLREGSSSEFAAAFSADVYRDQIFASRETLTSSAQAANGAYLDSFQPDFSQAFALTDVDGGALVFLPVQVTSSFHVTNATVSIPDTEKALLEGELSDKVTHHYADLLVFSIPAPGSERLPAVVAADHNLVKVTAN